MIYRVSGDSEQTIQEKIMWQIHIIFSKCQYWSNQITSKLFFFNFIFGYNFFNNGTICFKFDPFVTYEKVLDRAKNHRVCQALNDQKGIQRYISFHKKNLSFIVIKRRFCKTHLKHLSGLYNHKIVVNKKKSLCLLNEQQSWVIWRLRQ